MTHAFSELYIENAQRVFAQMTHYVIHDLKMGYDPFFRLFVQSGVAAQFEKGNPRYVAGMSGTELADEVMRRVTGHGCAIESEPYYDRTEAYFLHSRGINGTITVPSGNCLLKSPALPLPGCIPNTTKWILCIPPTRSEGFAGSLLTETGSASNIRGNRPDSASVIWLRSQVFR